MTIKEAIGKQAGHLVKSIKYNFLMFDLLMEGMWHKERRKIPNVWADYFFLAACYAKSLGAERRAEFIIGRLKEWFPNYDPLTRFGYERVFGSILQGGNLSDVNTEDLRDVGGLLDRMEKFCRENPSFSYVDNFGDYFRTEEEIKNLKDLPVFKVYGVRF